MITLALELSSPRCSLALFRDREPAARAEWVSSRRDPPRMFEELRRGLAEIGADASHIRAVAVGRGPGNYTGMRTALTLGETLLLPGGGELQAVSSGAAMARRRLEAEPRGRVVVVGDARRGRLWRGVFAQEGARMRTLIPWGLMDPAELARDESGDGAWVSYEAEAVTTRLREAGVAPLPIAQDYPRAEDVAALAWERADSGESPEPATPIYLHPPV